MREGPDIARIAALIGDPARANMLNALMSGLALTAGELAREAAITPQTASMHLAKLTQGALVLVEVQGRHRYYRLAGPDIAAALEGLMELASRTGQLRTRPGPRDQNLRFSRICYDHLAGSLGVQLHDALVEQGLIIATSAGLGVSEKGRLRFYAEGIDIGIFEQKSRAICRACLDWSERRHHLSGNLGVALLKLFMARGWAKRDAKSRAILFTPNGLRNFHAFCAADETISTRAV